MRKLVVAIALMLVVVASLSSCVSTRGPIPYGVWENSALGLVMDWNPDDNEFTGIYQNNGEAVEIYVGLSIFSKEFNIYKGSDKQFGDNAGYNERALFNGSYSLKDGKLYYSLMPYWEEKSGIIGTIIFEKIKEYDVPDEAK